MRFTFETDQTFKCVYTVEADNVDEAIALLLEGQGECQIQSPGPLGEIHPVNSR